MADDAEVKLSVRDSVKDFFEDVTAWTTPFTVYDADDLESHTTEPNRPFVYVITRKEPIEPRWLPIVVLDIETRNVSWQLGSTSRETRVNINIMGRSEGETSRIASKMRASLNTIAIYDYSGAIPVLEENQFYQEEWEQQEVVPPEEYLREGTLKHWLLLSNMFILP